MSEHALSSEQRLLALSRYISALEQGEIEPLAEILSQAEHDPVLARLLHELDAIYQQIDRTGVSEPEAQRALQMALAPLQAGMAWQENGGQQPALIQNRHRQHSGKEISMKEQEISPLSFENRDLPHPQKRPRLNRVQTLVAVLLVGILIAATSLFLTTRQQAGSGSHGQQKGPVATASPQTGHETYKALASKYVSHMSLNDKLGQLLMVQYPQPTYSSDLDYMLNTLHVGGVILYAFQVTSVGQARGDIAHMQARANLPLFISANEEGSSSYIDILRSIYGPRLSPAQIEQAGNVDVAKQQGLKVSRDLAALGLNVNLAPDVDVNYANSVYTQDRTFGNTPAQVIKYAGAYLQAMQGNGTIGCIKYFPGIGGATPDPHQALPVVNSSRQQIFNLDLAPFQAFIQSPNALLNPGMIMSIGVLMPAIDPKYPAHLSHTFVTDILRNQFHYDGVVLTDALYMQRTSDTWHQNTAVVQALQAGNDMLLGATNSQQASQMINAIKQALQDGRLMEARVDASVTRIVALKMQYHLMPTSMPGA